jgi:galactokinase
MRTFRAPGRVNLIGEHTDYNSGFVLPVAIQMATRVAVERHEDSRGDRRVVVRSANFDGVVEFDLDDLEASPKKHWSDYVRGVAIVIERMGHRLRGATLAISSDIPIGSGLSSSAAIEVATAMALLANSDVTIPPREIALLCQRAENEFVGARCGIMDQFTSVHGRAGHALLLDCRSLEASYFPIADRVKLVVVNTMVRHELASNEYNLRRRQCEVGVESLGRMIPGMQSLRDLTAAELDRYRHALDPVIARRCRHVVTENQRVLDACDALRAGDMTRFGELMIESHNSLRDDYDVSCSELDTAVALATKLEGVYGARMTGGGFGGCAINLVDGKHADQVAIELAAAYHKETGIESAVYICSASDGACEIATEAK